MHCNQQARNAWAGSCRRAAWALALGSPLAVAGADLEASLEITASAAMPDGTDHVEYQAAVANAGDSHAQAVKVLMRLPDEFVAPQWTCVAEGGASCGLAGGSGDVLFETEMPPGAAVRLAVVAGVHDPRQRGVAMLLESVTASAENDQGDNVAGAIYQRCSASQPMPDNGVPAAHPCTFVDSFEPR